MASVTAAIAAASASDEVAVVVAPETVEKPRRRFPPPCWTQEETLVLIEAYRERWYALRRGYLRTTDWDAVAAAVTGRCPGASPAKTSAQCRHKMEKLRQRYRAEKQRALSFPCPGGRYFSSWFFFENMEAMENGTTAQKPPENSSDGSGSIPFIDQNTLKLKLKANTNSTSTTDLGFDNRKRFNSGSNIPIAYLDMEIAGNDLIDLGMRNQPTNRIPISIPPLKPKSKKSGKMFSNPDASAGFHQQMPPPGLRIKQFVPDHNRINPNDEFWVRFPNNSSSNDHNNSTKFPDPGIRSKHWASLNTSSGPGPTIHGSKRRRKGLEEIVASIHLLGEGFVKMEKEKMEMAREMEAMRMEMEMKRNQMLLESQKQIVEAFLKGMFELKKCKKVKSSGVASEP